MRSRHLACLLPLLFTSSLDAAVSVSYVDLGPGGSACCLVPDGLGNIYVIGSVARPSGFNVSVTRMDAANHVAASFTFGGGLSDQPHAAALDPQGNLVIAGQTNSTDFPLVHALISQTESNAPAGFVTRVNPSNGQILFSTRLGGMATEGSIRVGTVVNALAVDPAGNIYAAGTTDATDFPVSADAFQKTGAGGGILPRPYGFVFKISPDGATMLYSTLLGGATANCAGGSHCVGKSASTTVNAIAVDGSGIATVAGSTNAPDFPVSSGALQTTCRCQEYANNGFVTQLNAGGNGLLWSTFLGGTWYGFLQIPFGTNTISALTMDAAGNVVVSGRTDASDFPTTPGVVQPHFAGPATPDLRPTDGFLSKLNPTGTVLLFSTYLGGSAEDRINAVQTDANGNLWITGATESSDFPGNPAPFTGSFFALVSSDGSSLSASQRTPLSAAGQAILTGDDVTVLGVSGSVLRVPAGQTEGAAILGVSSSAGGPVKGSVAPGEFVSLYGKLLGPAPGLGATLDSQGRLSTQIAGVQVLFSGIPAPLLYASQGQINALVPYGIFGAASVSVQVTTSGGNSPTVNLYVRPTQPEVFNTGGAALALNQDNSVNSPQNQAAPGSIVTVYASGAGLLNNAPQDGSIPATATSVPVLPVTVLFNNRSLEVLYAGNAPTLVVNVLQINVRLPQQAQGGEAQFQLLIGNSISDSFSLAVQ